MNRTTFKYNMSVYYQSVIAYMIVFLIYIVIRSFAVEADYHITKDPINYFFAFILVIAILSLLVNLFRNRHIEVNEDGIKFLSRGRVREIDFNNVTRIRFFRERGSKRSNPFRIIAFTVKQRRRPVVLNPNNYENRYELIKVLRDIKTKRNL